MIPKPGRKPLSPNFSSGPCANPPGYDLELLRYAPLGRSHRSEISLSRLRQSIDKTKELLDLPVDYRLGIVPASDTGAFEMAIWNLLGPRPIDVIYFEAFGETWASDIKNQLKLANVRYFSAPYGLLPDLSGINPDHDLVFTWNGTTSGVKIPDGRFIADSRKGLTLCDATSAVFAMDIPWRKIDVATFSWQKVLGGEAAHGMLILSPRAVERLDNYQPAWPLPKIMQLTKNGILIGSIFSGSTINTPSMLCNEDYLAALRWAENIGGKEELFRRSEQNLASIESFVSGHEWIDFLAVDPATRSNTSVCLTTRLDPERLQALINLLEEENVAYDIASYRDAPKGLRFWCGATVEREDLEIALQWLKWAYETVIAETASK